MQFSRTSTSPPQTPRQIAAQQNSIRSRIRKLIQRLPDDEAQGHATVLEKAKLKLKAEKGRERRLRFDGDSLPAEIQNMIFRFAMTTPEIIVPDVSDPCRADRRKWRRYDLSGQILRLNKTICQQTLPTLLGENTFEFNYGFHWVLGMGRTAPTKRAALVRKIVTPVYLRARMVKDLHRLTNVAEVTILSRRQVRWPEEMPPDDDKAAGEFQTVHNVLKDKIKDSPRSTFHFVHEIDGRARNKKMLAYRWDIRHDPIIDRAKLTLIRSKEYETRPFPGYPLV